MDGQAPASGMVDEQREIIIDGNSNQGELGVYSCGLDNELGNFFTGSRCFVDTIDSASFGKLADEIKRVVASYVERVRGPLLGSEGQTVVELVQGYDGGSTVEPSHVHAA